MSYTLSAGLSSQPKIVELADFWEIECLRKVDHSVSIQEIVQIIGIADDVQENETEQNEMELEGKQISVIEEIRRRIDSSNMRYPFQINETTGILNLTQSHDGTFIWIYLFLLLATRNNMSSNKVVDNIDGTKVFEKLSKDALINYLGPNAQGMNFGTAQNGSFYQKLGDLVTNMKEGTLHPTNNNITYNPQDDTLDIVVWVPFFDKLPSKIICFAQCKTGTHWVGSIKQLNVSDFLKKWFSRHPSLNPIETYMIADILAEENYYNRSVNNLFFDRCRIISFCRLSNQNDLFLEMRNWTQYIMQQFNLSI